MSEAKLNFDFSEVDKLEKTFEQMEGKAVQKMANTAARKGADIVGATIRKNAPVGKTGELKRGFRKTKERSKLYGKAVYDYAMDKNKDAIFQKKLKNPGVLGGKSRHHAYYPSSVEYGFLARAKGGGVVVRRYNRRLRMDDLLEEHSSKIRVTGVTRHGVIKAVETVTGTESKRVEGQHFVRKSAEEAAAPFSERVKRELFTELEKEWKK